MKEPSSTDTVTPPIPADTSAGLSLLVRTSPYLVFFISCSIALIFWFLYDGSLNRRAEAVYHDKTDEILTHIVKRMQGNEQILRGAAGLFNASMDVSRDEWRRYVATLALSENYPGIQGVGFSKWITPEEKERNISAIRAEGFPEYTIRPEGSRPAYTSIIYLEPFDWRNQRAFGYDMFSETVRRGAMEMARDTGRTTIAAKIILVQETDKDRQNGMLMYVPVYRRGAHLETVTERRRAITGFAYSPIRINDFVTAALGSLPNDIAFELYAHGTTGPENLMFSSQGAESTKLPDNYRPLYRHKQRFHAYGREWLISFRTLPGFDQVRERDVSTVVLCGGVLVSLMLTFIAVMIRRHSTATLAAAGALRDSESRYRSIFDIGPDGIVIIDPESSAIIAFNDQACRQLGYTRDEFEGLCIADIEMEESPETVREHIRRIMAQGIDEFDTRHRSKAGDVRDVHVKASYSNIGGRYLYHCVWRDITRERKEEKIKQARLHLLEYALTHTLDELLTETLGMVEELTGSMIGFYHFLQEDQRTLTLHAWSERTRRDFCKAEGAGSHYGVDQAGVWVDCIHQRRPVIHNDYASLPHRKGLPPGHAPVIRELVVPIFRSGAIVGILGIGNKASDYNDEDIEIVTRFADLAWDAAERKVYFDALRESNEKFSAAFNNAPIMITISTLDDGTYLDVNQRFLETSGFSRDDVIGRSAVELGWLAGETQLQVQELLERDGCFKELEMTATAKSGRSLHCSSWGELLTIGSRRCNLFIALDITEHRRVEQQFLQAQKMESIGRLAGGVAHDFNNMLSVIIGHAELGLLRSEAGSKIHGDLEVILNAATRSADITRQLLMFARRQATAPKTIELNDTIAGMLKMFRRLIGEDIELQWKPGNDLWRIRIDPSQLDQVLANLCVNARDAIAGVGCIMIETDNCPLTAEGFDDPAGAAGPRDYVMIRVTDNGSGMAPETISHIFEPFYTTKELGRGTGLGLATVFGIVKQNNGVIQVDSEPGKGTEFRIYLPAEEQAADDVIQTAAGPVGGSGTILVVEDEPDMLRLTTSLLTQLGYRVLEAELPEKAISLLEQQPGTIDLLLTDLVMPGMSGRDLATILTAARPDLKCLFMSGYTADILSERGSIDRHTHFLPKPFTLQSLSAKVREVLDSSP